MNVLNDMRRFDEAVAIGEETVASQLRTLGPEHPTTTNCQAILQSVKNARDTVLSPFGVIHGSSEIRLRKQFGMTGVSRTFYDDDRSLTHLMLIGRKQQVEFDRENNEIARCELEYSLAEATREKGKEHAETLAAAYLTTTQSLQPEDCIRTAIPGRTGFCHTCASGSCSCCFFFFFSWCLSPLDLLVVVGVGWRGQVRAGVPLPRPRPVRPRDRACE